jgi:hypothetical protein
MVQKLGTRGARASCDEIVSSNADRVAPEIVLSEKQVHPLETFIENFE